MKELESLKLERHVLAGIVKFPDNFGEFDQIISEKDFVSKTHQIIFSVTKGLIGKRTKFDRVLLAQKLKDFGISSYEEVSIFDYCDNLFDNPIKKDAIIGSVKELVELRVKRDIVKAAKEVEKHVISSRDKPLPVVIQECDSIYNSKINGFIVENTGPRNIYDTLENVIEDIGNNPPDPSQFKFGPFQRVNEQFGSLLRPHNITVIGARTGVAKTSLGMFYLTHIADHYNTPI
jgi:replicative DNA helicase